jgi:hypothetical protein
MNFIDDLGVTIIVFFFNGHARLRSVRAVEIWNFQKRKSKCASLISKKSVNTNKYAEFRQPAARRWKKCCIYEILATFCEFRTLIGNIYDLLCSINILTFGDAR